MSDLCSPMIMLLEDEGDAFWCFERLMRRLVLTFLHQSIKFFVCLFYVDSLKYICIFRF